ncbi:MAG: methyltransferase domain-containing protein [Pseudomonadota bacterium]
MSKTYLDTVYDIEDADATKALYGEWAASYDAEVRANGYATPARCAKALATFAEDTSAPLMDVGCGTGLSGEAFAQAGFSTLDGSDFSPEMMALARAKGIYRALYAADLSTPLPFELGDYNTIAAVGVLNPKHAPAETLDDVMTRLNPGGLFVFSLNDHALSDGSYEGRLREQVDGGSAELLFSEHGTHLPKIDLMSTVYVLRKR